MKLLFDQNLSPRLTRLLADIYADSIHVREVGLRDADDLVVWECQAAWICHRFERFRLPTAESPSWCTAKIHLVACWQLHRRKD